MLSGAPEHGLTSWPLGLPAFPPCRVVARPDVRVVAARRVLLEFEAALPSVVARLRRLDDVGDVEAKLDADLSSRDHEGEVEL